MKQVIIHVGMGKTGTSAIQQTLRAKRKALAACGVKYGGMSLLAPDLGGLGFETKDAYKAALRAEPPHFSERAAEALRHALLPDSVQAIVWSDEGLPRRYKHIGGVVQSLASEFDVSVVMYFRNHVDWLISAYLQWAVKHKFARGRVRTFEKYVTDTAKVMDYCSVIDTWRAHVGADRMIARSYDRAPDIVADFVEATGLQRYIDSRDLLETVQANSTPSYTALSLFKIYNDQFEPAMGTQPLRHLLEQAGVLDRDVHAVDPVPIDVSDMALSELSEGFKEQRELLRSRYQVDLNETHRPNKWKRREHTSPANSDLIAALLMVNLHLYDRVRRLEDRSAETARRAGKLAAKT